MFNVSKIRFFALGGLGENGKNMYVVEVDQQLFIMDAGIKYPSQELYGVDEIIPDYKRLTTFMKNNKIPRTSNTVENYYRQTEPEQIKKKYKTKKGILTYLHYKMKNWTKKHIKK